MKEVELQVELEVEELEEMLRNLTGAKLDRRDKFCKVAAYLANRNCHQRNKSGKAKNRRR